MLRRSRRWLKVAAGRGRGEVQSSPRLGWGYLMLRSSMRRAAVITVVASATVIVGMVDQAAADVIEFPAGVACEFPVILDAGADPRSTHELTDANGNERVILAGRGSTATLTNGDTGATLSFRSNGAPWSIVTDAFGTSTFTTMGHLILFLFPTDVPAGPSTTLYVGRVVFTFDFATGFTVVKSSNGTATDLCAALSA